MAGKGVNRVIIVGNLGADPEMRNTGNGTAVATLRIATSESWTDKQSGEKQERTEWHRAKMFGRLAEIAGDYLKKGRQIYIEGSLRTEKYTDKDGVERYSTDIVVSEMQMLGGNDGASSGNGQGSGNRSSSNNQSQQNRQSNHGNGNGSGNGNGNRPSHSSQGRSDAPRGHQPAYDDFDTAGENIPF